MTAPTRETAAFSATPTGEVRRIIVVDEDNGPLPRISLADANALWARGWAEWIGKKTRRHLRLTAAAPLRRTPPGSGTATRRDRADQTCGVYAAGQPFGSRVRVEFIPQK